MTEGKTPMTLHPILASYIPVLKGLAEALGPDYEIVLPTLPDFSWEALQTQDS